VSEASGLAQDDPNKKKRRKWVDMNENTAYLRAISIGMSAMEPAIKVCVILDEASRMILAGGGI
jgi:putative transposase